MMKYSSDRQLVNNILKGNEKALRAYYSTYSSRLYRYIQSKISQSEDAEEVFQDTLLASLEAMRDYSGSSSLYTYIYSIAKHKVIDYYRRKKIKHTVFSKLPFIEDVVSAVLSPEQRYDRRELSERIYECFNKLKPRYQQVVKLNYVEGLTVGEIAVKTSETIKSVESTLFRARKVFTKVFVKV